MKAASDRYAPLAGLVVLKFGGTSLASASSIASFVQIVKRRRPQPIVLVLSAIGSTTDRLARIADLAVEGRVSEANVSILQVAETHRDLIRAVLGAGGAGSQAIAEVDELIASLGEIVSSVGVLQDLSPPVEARILAFGELLSTRLLTAVLRNAGLSAIWIDARDLIVTALPERQPASNAIRSASRERLLPLLDGQQIPVTQGYIARTSTGVDTTLGRGGSDLTATLLGAALGAHEVEIWTDVDGVMTADPSLVPTARSIPVMAANEAAELAFFGAKVLHPKSLVPALERDIPVRVRNTRCAHNQGTLIVSDYPRISGTVTSIAYQEGMAVLRLASPRMFGNQGFLERFFAVLEEHRVIVHAVATSEVTVAIATIDDQGLAEAMPTLRTFGTVEVSRRQALVSVVGHQLLQSPEVVARTLGQLSEVEVSMISLGGSHTQLGFVIAESELESIVGRLHERLVETVWQPQLTGGRSTGYDASL